MEKTAVVILNYNGVSFLETFLPGVVENTPHAQIIVVDNASTDTSVSFLQQHFPEVEQILLPVNLGYSEGYNQALRQIGADYYVLLNSDIEVTPGWLTPLIELMQSDAQIAACQPKIRSYHDRAKFEYAGAAGGYIDTFGYPFCKGRLFQTLEKDNGQYNDIYPVFWATGACLVIRSDVYHTLGGMDPDFFAHMEEIDLCWRIEASGMKVMYHGGSQVFHVGGGTLESSNPRKTYLNFRNGLTLLFKNYTSAELWIRFPVRLFLDWVAAWKFFLLDSPANGWAVVKAHVHFWQNWPENRKKRKRSVKISRIHNHQTMYKGSVVWAYYILGKRTFNRLKFPGAQQINNTRQNYSADGGASANS